jgi:hypothetical protein
MGKEIAPYRTREIDQTSGFRQFLKFRSSNIELARVAEKNR